MSMSSETEILKTNEFLRRRKLRLQQVREQSKDIAKKIRQRAKVEKLRQIVDLDSKREKDYFLKQEKLVKRLEQLYAQGVRSVGNGHKKASEETHNECSPRKDAISKIRGKEAVAELRRRKQEKLDEQKKVLDRKLLAREAANEISREKSSTVANKLIAKSSSSKLTVADANENPSDDVPKVTRTDMATQWDFEELPSEWEPNVPALSLPRDDKESVKDSNNAAESKSDKSKRLDLFALSAEMPSSLRGGLSNVPEDRPSIRPSLTLVSEYLQSRALRLREADTTGSSKKQADDLSNIKNTILRSRSSKVEAKGSLDKSTVSSAVETNLTKKNSVTMYNHSTRDSRDIPCGDSRLVVRDLQTDEDAYSQALKEATTDHVKDKEHQKKLQEMRNKVAMTKQTVEKEYLDTMSFLKSLPKDNSSKPVKNAYMDERRQRLLKASRQQKLQQEFNKIEKECRKNCENKRAKQTITDRTPKKSKSPGRDRRDNFESRDLQYSWMPVPEGDGNLAIHTIPTTLKEAKSGNTVKFSKVDSYHEYRSRHKHTPPTKDTNHNKQPNKKVVETVIIQNDNDESTYCSSISSDTSSVENMNLENKDQAPDTAMSEADRIIIYKILDKKEKERKKLKLIDNVAKVLKSLDKEKQKSVNDNNNNKEDKGHSRGEDEPENSSPIQHVDEGVYKVISEKGDNIASLYFTDKVKTQERSKIVITEDEQRFGRPCCCKKKSNSYQQIDKGTNLHCRADEDSGIRSGNCLGCKCGCENNPRPKAPSTKAVKPTVQPSAATSTSSFKTATTDKAHSALPDGGYINLIDDDGHEAGKFYIGASGFLKDDAYEVIIQLRKKEQKLKADQEKETLNNLQKNYGINNETVLSVQDLGEEDTSNRPKSNLLKEVTEKADTGRKEVVLETNTKTPKVLPQTSSAHVNNTLNDNEVNDFAESDQLSSGGSAVSSNEANSKRMPKLVDKGVHTSFQLSFAIPSDVPKTDNIPRPATSTYTQTTMDSPNPRPLFIHMSSSTSTAYMSPPDMVLPNFMKNDFEYQGERLKFPNRYNHCENEKCTRKRCKCRKAKAPASSRKFNNSNILNPPPNTARGDNDNSDTYVDEFQLATRNKHSDKCHKCTNKSSSASKFPNKNVKNRHAPLHKMSSRNLIMRVSSSTASSFKNKIHSLHTNKSPNKSDLNPIIKKYVNRLLELNREGIKAIEVANQECSSVSTPGSSIIEVPRNLNDKESSIDNKLSLEQMKNLLKQKILEEYVKETTNNSSVQTLCNTHKSRTGLHKLPKKRSVHRVKSLNISKRLLKTKKQSDTKSSNLRNLKTNPSTSSPSSARETITKQPGVIHNNTKPRSKSSPTPRQYPHYEKKSNKITSNPSDNIYLKSKKNNLGTKSNSSENSYRQVKPQLSSNKTNNFSMPIHRVTTTSPDSELEALKRRQEDEAAMNISTQTSQDLDSEINLMKLAEDKLQNMEKIADLTEKCTKRLSNLAKVLEEVRRNKSLAYSQISTSDTASDSEYRSDKNVSENNVTKRSVQPASDVQDKTDPRPSTATSTEQEEKEQSLSSDYVPFLMNMPKPAEFKYPAAQSKENVSVKSKLITNSNIDGVPVKRREKPPPALSRMHLKYGQDIIPHELSTVVEVDSPMSMKMKNKSSTNTKCELSDISYKMNNDQNDQNDVDKAVSSANSERPGNPDLLLQSNTSVSKPHNKNSTDSSDDSKLQMMDLKQFNELMLKPFISIQEFAKQCGGDVGPLDDGSNLEDIPKDDGMNDELSSLHSDGSLPDVIAELLKRNIITEPFKFDTMSNVNSTTVSSESMMSVLALSKVRKEKKKSSVVFQNKGNGSETSDSLSISSNPDLENAFKKLGMGWASSTLKKTKERLALSSSSNTSSSSLSQFKLKSLNDQDIPVLVTDSVLSATKLSFKKHQEKKAADISRNAEQQTSFMNSMTVKEFLTNELAKKITFTNKSNRSETEDEFVSLFETKMPDEMKHISLSVREERSMDSVASAQNNRARTSTPVQIFKSMTYHSSSSSNMSNGLFSNADDLSSVKVTSNSVRNHSTSDKDDLTIPNFSLKMRKGASDCSKSE